MKTQSPNPRGRKPKHHIAANGDQIKGLAYDKKSGRWRIIEGNRFFRAANEAEAIEKFKRLTGEKPTVEQLVSLGCEYDATDPEQLAIYGPNGILSRGAWEASKRLWTYVAEQVIRRPQWVAEQTGIEKLGYLTELKPPAPLPSLDERSWSISAVARLVRLPLPPSNCVSTPSFSQCEEQ